MTQWLVADSSDMISFDLELILTVYENRPTILLVLSASLLSASLLPLRLSYVGKNIRSYPIIPTK